MNAKHTPGPWAKEGSLIIAARELASEERVICSLRGTENAKANGLFIIAAPETAAERDRLREINADLLAALEGLLELNENPGMSASKHSTRVDNARAALTRAKGD